MSNYPLTVVRDLEQPHGGWKFTVEETGVTFTGPTSEILRTRVKDHLRANSLPLAPDFNDWFNNELCQQMNLGHPFCGKPAPKPVPGMLPYLTFGVATRFIKTLYNVIKDRKFVEVAEAQRRLDICMQCPLAVDIGGCKGCTAIFRLAEEFAGDRLLETPKEKEFCGACACKLNLKVLIANDTLDRAEPERPAYWGNCWRNQGDA